MVSCPGNGFTIRDVLSHESVAKDRRMGYGHAPGHNLKRKSIELDLKT